MREDGADPFDDGTVTRVPGCDMESSADAIAGMVQRVAEIEDELARRGADPLLRELDGLKKGIKERMLAGGLDEVFDEVSEYEAVIQQRSSDEWDAAALERALNAGQRRRYLVVETRVDTAAVAEGVKNGDLSRGELEVWGAVRKALSSKALYVRKRRVQEDVV